MNKGRPLKSARVPQVCVVPFRRFGDGTAFCLITSLRKRLWIFPKGTVNGGESLREAALKEAHEEAGLHGRIVGPPLGRYLDSKRGAVLDVTVLLMEVKRSDDVWEEDTRLRCWMDGRGALAAPRQAAASDDAAAGNQAAVAVGWSGRTRVVVGQGGSAAAVGPDALSLGAPGYVPRRHAFECYACFSRSLLAASTSFRSFR